MSRGEEYIARLLQREGIKFKTEYRIKDLRNGLCRFDFYLPELDVFLEFNGAQHYTFTPHFYDSKSDFLKAQERDRRKISYCLARHKHLYIIPYWDLDSIHKSSDLFQEKYFVKSKFHNDIAYRMQKTKTL